MHCHSTMKAILRQHNQSRAEVSTCDISFDGPGVDLQISPVPEPSNKDPVSTSCIDEDCGNIDRMSSAGNSAEGGSIISLSKGCPGSLSSSSAGVSYIEGCRDVDTMSLEGDPASFVSDLSKEEGGSISSLSEEHPGSLSSSSIRVSCIDGCRDVDTMSLEGDPAPFVSDLSKVEPKPAGWVQRHRWLLCLGAAAGLLAVPALICRQASDKNIT